MVDFVKKNSLAILDRILDEYWIKYSVNIAAISACYLGYRHELSCSSLYYDVFDIQFQIHFLSSASFLL